MAMSAIPVRLELLVIIPLIAMRAVELRVAVQQLLPRQARSAAQRMFSFVK